MRVDLSIQQEGVGLLAVVNPSTDTVRLTGWPHLAFETADRSTVTVGTLQPSAQGVNAW